EFVLADAAARAEQIAFDDLAVFELIGRRAIEEHDCARRRLVTERRPFPLDFLELTVFLVSVEDAKDPVFDFGGPAVAIDFDGSILELAFAARGLLSPLPTFPG